jgi:hypothetical protein
VTFQPQEREEDTFAIGGMDFLFGDTDGNEQHNASGFSFLGKDRMVSQMITRMPVATSLAVSSALNP